MLLFFSGAANASENDPAILLQDVSRQLFSSLKSEQQNIEQRPQRLFELVNEIIGPHVNFPRVSRWVLGKHWHKATSKQKKRFMLEFRSLLIRFYTSALLDDPKDLDELLLHTDTLIRFKPAAEDRDKDKMRVHAEVHLPSGMTIPIIFRMHRSKNGEWKIVDLTVDGISLVTTYRSSFSTEIRRKGLGKMLDHLAERNRQLVKRTETKKQ
ncbi:MAG: ABC transporter substrate-binding protein [Gammaproteobacteria bacterium]|nr:ABC transporter substrate-binding protein [Gammaproteobacteria bacterium]